MTAPFWYGQTVGRRKYSKVFPLDAVSGLVFGFSLRRLRAAFVDDAILLRRSSDNATAWFRFAASGALDEFAIKAWCGSASAYVVSLKCQFTGQVVTNATAAAQPRLINAGVMETMGGKPALRFLGAQRLVLTITPTTLWNTSFGSITVGQVNADAANDCNYFGFSTSGGSYRGGVRRNFTTATVGDIHFTAGNSGNINVLGPFSNPETTPHMLEFFMSAAGRAVRRDGIAMAERSGSNSAPAVTGTQLIIGSNVSTAGATAWFEGHLGELVVLGNCSDADVAAAGAALRPAWGL